MSLVWADRLRNLATAMVVILHTSAPVAEQFQPHESWEWWSANFWDSFTRPSVPLFVMLSGFLLLGKDYELGFFFKRRFTRVVIPALFWMGIYMLYGYLAHGVPGTIGEALLRLVEGPVHYHLWFVYLIIGLYLVYPILRPWVRTASELDFLYFIGMWFIGTSVYKILHVFFDVQLGIYLELFTNNAGYFVLGYYLGEKITLNGASTLPAIDKKIQPLRLHSGQLTAWAIAFILLGGLTTFFGTYWISAALKGGQFHNYFYDYLTPNVNIGAVGWFVLAIVCFNRTPLLEVETQLAACSYGIYFIHAMVLDWWSEVGYWHSKSHPLTCVPIVFCLAFVLSFTAVLIIRALPGGTKIT
jgi:surface polysaccharide O-acyltransferase-like enzyme